MTFQITGIIMFLLLLVWQFILYKRIKLKKWQNWTFAIIMVGLAIRMVYLAFIL